MPLPLNPALATTFAPPVMEARRWLEGMTFPLDRPLIALSQAAPMDPPPPAMLAAMVEALADPATHRYGPVLGLPELRATLAQRITRAYGAQISDTQIAITSGCNQAFCAVMATIAGAGDEVILPTPWYFNHAMWLQMQGVRVIPLPCGAGMLPDPEQATALITSRTRAIVLVTPNNPTGAEYPAPLMAAFRDLARARDVALIVDETYADFDSRDTAPHDLFSDPDWDDTLVRLYSFSKAYRLTGHRVGALATSPTRLRQIEKFLDTTTICPAILGQRAALWGLAHLDDWLAGERLEVLARRDTIAHGIGALEGWQVKGCGAYFAYVAHPFDTDSTSVARALLARASLLVLPGTMFAPDADTDGPRHLRIAFANADRAGIATVIDRLAGFAM
jgi:aspartate/methionine/tyrosine aminotransferase